MFAGFVRKYFYDLWMLLLVLYDVIQVNTCSCPYYEKNNTMLMSFYMIISISHLLLIIRIIPLNLL